MMQFVSGRLQAAHSRTAHWYEFRLPWWGWVAAVAVVVCDATVFLLPSPWEFRIGDEYLLASTAPAVVLAAALGVATWKAVRAHWVLYTLIGALLAASVFAVATSQMPADMIVTWTVAAIVEELSFRIALPLLVFATVRWVTRRRMSDPTARVVALVVAAAVFTVAPGHVAQMVGPLDWVPFLFTAFAWGMVVFFTGQWLAVGLVHASSNLITFWMTLPRWEEIDSVTYDQAMLIGNVVRVVGLVLLVVLFARSVRTEPKDPPVPAGSPTPAAVPAAA